MSGYGMNLPMILNQQCMNAVALAQQAVMAEQSGFGPGALMAWEQACATLYGVVMQANQAMLPLSDQVHYGLAVAQYHTARLKFIMGRGMESPGHLQVALQAIHAALMQNPGFQPYHASAGGLLACVGNLPAAAQELSIAVQMNPADLGARSMLMAVQTQMGQMGMTPMQSGFPQPMPPPQNPMPGWTPQAQMPNQGGGLDKMNQWVKTIGVIFDTASSGIKLGQQLGMFG